MCSALPKKIDGVQKVKYLRKLQTKKIFYSEGFFLALKYCILLSPQCLLNNSQIVSLGLKYQIINLKTIWQNIFSLSNNFKAVRPDC